MPDPVVDVLALLPVPAATIDTATGCVRWVNDAACELLGRPAAELTSLALPDIVDDAGDGPPDETPRAPSVPAMPLGAADRSYLRPDGTVVRTRTHLVALPEGSASSAIALFVGTSDGTAREADPTSTASTASTAMFESVFESSSTGMQIVSRDGRYERVNDAFTAMVGWSADELVGRHWRSIVREPDTHDADIASVAAALADADRREFDSITHYVRPDRSVMWGSVTVSPLPAATTSSDESPLHLLQVVDVTAEVDALAEVFRVKEELRESEQRYRALMEPAPDAVVRLDRAGRVIDSNNAAQRLFDFATADGGVPLADVLPAPMAERIADLVATIDTGSGCEIGRERIVSDGSEAWYRVRLVPEITDGVVTIHLVLSDITALAQNERRLASIALTDGLTGVCNRVSILDRLGHALDRLGRGRSAGLAVAVLDLDHFKSVNDAFGHAFGDAALRATAERVSASLRDEDSLGRLGGDEFLVVLEDVPSPEIAREVATRVFDAVNPFVVELAGGHGVTMTSSIGLTWVSTNDPVDDVVLAADQALFEAKRRGRGRMWSTTDRPQSSGQVRHRGLSRELMEALKEDQFTLRFQPLVDDRRQVCGVEALLRWEHPERGLLAPDEFIDRLISSGQMGPVGAWVLQRSVGQLAEWDAAGLDGLQMHVNASPSELAHPSFPDHLARAFEAHPVDPGRVNVEVTEQALEGTLVSTSVLRDIASTGTRIVLDDFGTGVSSLTHLRTDPLDGIKIDRSFISGSAPGDIDRRIVTGVIGLAHGIGVDVTAEGVETAEQADWVASTGCERQQGYYFGRPITAEDLFAVATAQRRERSARCERALGV
ncbi:EAL domain-containing protein [Ilumatobacter sp.]|uniref:sensor domain-containing protein n=1 Tax=Ilumatobacter sp. TaxID=1967498 RepID=UPI003B5226BE